MSLMCVAQDEDWSVLTDIFDIFIYKKKFIVRIDSSFIKSEADKFLFF